MIEKEELKALVEKQLAEIAQLRNGRHGSAQFRRWRRVTLNTLRAVYGEEHIHYRVFGGIIFGAQSIPSTEEKEQLGFMKGLDHAEPFLQALLFEIANFGIVTKQVPAETAPNKPTNAWLPLELKDVELRERCVDLLAAPDKYDRAVREACVVLEHRVRTLIGADTSLLGVTLMTEAFRKESGALVLADDLAEQDGAHQLYRGIMGFLKNPTSHRLVTSYSRNRALEVIGFIDFLLDILQEARIREESPAANQVNESGSAQ